MLNYIRCNRKVIYMRQYGRQYRRPFCNQINLVGQYNKNFMNGKYYEKIL